MQTSLYTLKTVCFNVHDHIKGEQPAIRLHRELCRLLKQRSVDAYVDLAQHCIQKGVYALEICM